MAAPMMLVAVAAAMAAMAATVMSGIPFGLNTKYAHIHTGTPEKKKYDRRLNNGGKKMEL